MAAGCKCWLTNSPSPRRTICLSSVRIVYEWFGCRRTDSRRIELVPMSMKATVRASALVNEVLLLTRCRHCCCAWGCLRGCHGCLWHRQKAIRYLLASAGSGLGLTSKRLAAGFPMLQQPVLGTDPLCIGRRAQALVAAIGPQASGLDVVLEMDMQDILDDCLS